MTKNITKDFNMLIISVDTSEVGFGNARAYIVEVGFVHPLSDVVTVIPMVFETLDAATEAHHVMMDIAVLQGATLIETQSGLVGHDN